MQRWKITIEYDGAPFVGWQRQDNGVAVQTVIEQALLQFAGTPTPTIVAGRTDAGVHARGQVAHFDLDAVRDSEHIINGLNSFMHEYPVAVIAAEKVDDTFSARFSALRRHYTYRIINRRTSLALDKGRAWRIAKPLDIAAMQQAAQYFIGHHDFTSFRASHCQAQSPMRTVEKFMIEQRADHEILAHITAPSFLHHQVRNMIGTLSLVGRGKILPTDIKEMLLAKDRSAAGPTAPPDGLYFMRVDY